MTNGNNYDFGSWKFGKGRAFTHIPTNFIMLIKINSIKNYLIKRGRMGLCLKESKKYRFWKLFLKTFEITNI